MRKRIARFRLGERRNGTGLATDLIVRPMSRLTVLLFVTTVVGDQRDPS